MTTMLDLATQQRTHPSADVTVPEDVVDVLLWRLAFDVAVEHQPGPDGDCTNLRCTGQRGPCDAAIQAQHALRAARRPATSAPQATRPTVCPPVMAASQHPDRAVGRAAVTHPNTGRFTGWFTQTATAAANRWREHLPRRVPGAVLTAT